MAYGLQLKFERLQAGVLQYRLAAALGVTPQFVSMVELGRKPLTEEFTRRYRDVLEQLRVRPVASDDGDDRAA